MAKARLRRRMLKEKVPFISNEQNSFHAAILKRKFSFSKKNCGIF
jgi:hypothetical protein